MNQYLDHIFDEVDNTIHLDEEQKKVVTEEGDILVIAGAGSGKTTTMVAKVKYLIDIKKVKPEEILLISYTNKATEELEERIQKQFQMSISILTFHKLGLQLLKKQKVEIQTELYPILETIIKQLLKEKKWKWKIYLYARKYYSKKDLSKLIILSVNFIKNYKVKVVKIEDMKLSKFWKQFLKLLIGEYEAYMKIHHQIDFEDMILEATKMVKTQELDFKYRYIIVDEYQDISKDRFLLLEAIKEKWDCNLIVVGDDWQSIFGFSGSEIKLFTEFKTYFKNSKQLKITNTYRNSQELIDIAGNFVMKNPLQIQKQLHSHKHISFPIVLVSYGNEVKQLFRILEYISKLRPFSTVFLLGRYHRDFSISKYPFFIQKEKKIICPSFSNLEIIFLTVHSAKGLGADEVIVLNGKNDIYGFPTKKKTNPILKQVETHDNSYPYAEERRLFYVALTRTKNHVFLLYPKHAPSIFLKEIKQNDRKQIINFNELVSV